MQLVLEAARLIPAYRWHGPAKLSLEGLERMSAQGREIVFGVEGNYAKPNSQICLAWN